MSMNDVDYNELFGTYRRLVTEAVALKEEILRQGMVPPIVIFDTEAFIGTAELETNGSFQRLIKEAKERHGIVDKQ